MSTVILTFQTSKTSTWSIMLINVTSADQTIYIFISDGGASATVGDGGVASPKCVWGGGRKGKWSPENF
jgi:hypothetical protein